VLTIENHTQAAGLDPLWGTMGQVIPLFERRGILPELSEITS
jgi:hypothetical protein